MGCPYYKNDRRETACLASVTHLRPDAEEAVKYCMTEEHYRCPFLLASVLRGNANIILAAN